MVHLSTDYVFDGSKDGAYDEADEPSPLSVYGRSKLLGERHVRAALAEHFIVRTAFVFGGGTDHLSTQVARLRAGQDAAAIADRVGSPTYVRHLAERLVPLALTARYGTYHLAGPEPTTWYDLVVRCKDLGGFDGEVTPQRADDLRLPAVRPRQSALVSVLVENLSIPAMPPLDVALRDLLAR
jgi:dTDP-4-dehydrorhamnose reductase